MPPASQGLDALTPDLLESLVPTSSWLARVAQSPALTAEVKYSVLTSALVRLSAAGAAEEVEYLLQPALTSLIDANGTDVDGTPAIVLATSLRHGECVRLLVEGGADIDARDAAGWSALHWAAQGSDFHLAAYLLNHRASMDVMSAKGLRPIDLVRKSKEGDAMRDVLSYAAERADAEGNGDSPRRPSAKARGKMRSREASVSEEEKKRFEMAKDCCQHLELGMEQLGMGQAAGPSKRKRSSVSNRLAHVDDFDWEHCELDQLIIFSEHDLPALFHVVIDAASVIPDSHVAADVLYLAARYAALMGPDGLLDDLLLGAMERVEAVVHTKSDNMALLAFWLSNMLTLLHYLKRDTQMDGITSLITPVEDEEEDIPSLQIQLTDLINELFVFVIRDIEKRIDVVLEPAMLDYESLPFEDVRFEGEWRFAKAFNSVRSKRESMGPASSIRALFGAESPSPPVSERAARRGQSMTNLRTPPSPSPTSHSPRTISALLSALLFVLQTYRLPTYIILQALAQVIYWISCELFNRIIAKRRHLARSRAVQIRLNASSLEDWARINHLPIHVISRPFDPLNALLQWLQCLSSERGLNDLLRTLQNLRSLNPIQLRKAAREYRYEMEEPRMADECAQYLVQMQRDWERGRVETSLGELPVDEVEASERNLEEVTRHLDDVFGVERGGASAYEAPEAPPCLGELLNSRHMLPFALPSNRSLLLPHHGGDTFGPLASASPVRLPPVEITPSLPDGFLAQLDVAAERLRAARAVDAHNIRVRGLGLGLESPALSTQAVNGWREGVVW